MRSRFAFIAVALFVSLHAGAQTKYTASPSGFSYGNQIKLQIDTVYRRAIVRKNDDLGFWNSGTMQLLQDGVQMGIVSYAAKVPEVIVPFSWNFTSGSRTFTAKAFSSDNNQFLSGSVVVTATPPTVPPTITSGSVSPGTGGQSATMFLWDAWARSGNAQPFGLTLWIVQPNGVTVAFPMNPVLPANWAGSVRFTYPKKLLSFGNYSYYFTSGTARYPQSGALYGPSTTPLVRMQMSSSTHHVGVHLYRNIPPMRGNLRLIRDTATNNAMTACFEGNGKQAQLAVQIEGTFADYTKGEAAFLSQLDQDIDTALSEGFAVHLLLSVHERPANPKWRTYDFSQTWTGTKPFIPYQPSKERGSLYDTIAETFQTEVLQHLVATHRAEKLAVVYVMNEFDYDTTLSDSEVWTGCGATKTQRTECRNAALAYTAMRVLNVTRTAAAGKVRIGLKFASVSRPSSAFLKPSVAGLGDQLAYLLTGVMAPMGDILGFDSYFDDANLYDKTNYYRLSPFLPAFTNGRLEIAEYGRICNGYPSQFGINEGRTRPADIRGIATWWTTARGFNLFAFNATGTPGGCYAIYNNGNWAQNGGLDGKAELAGLWGQITAITGSNPQACSN